MMKVSLSLALIVIVGLVASSNALPARKRMVYYSQPAQYYSAPQRMMYVQYVQPSHNHGRSAQAASALVAGESVATGTYLKEADLAAAGPAIDVSVEQQQRDEDVLSASGAHGASSVAEAYPENTVSVSQQSDVESGDDVSIGADVSAGESSDDAAKVPREYSFGVGAGTFGAGVGVENEGASVASDLPAPVPIAPVATPAKGYLPSKKKVYVELEHSAEGDEVIEEESANGVALDAEEDETDDTDVAVAVVPKKPVARRPVAKKPAKGDCAGCKAAKPLPVGTFFPIEFGGTAGGAIAIANSFSTGEGGSATSHAIAYGTPEASRARVRPSKRH